MADHFTSHLLNSGSDIPDGHYEEESMKQTVVPFRNGIRSTQPWALKTIHRRSLAR
jgi:7-cyano-7-deazaguanine synthase in queuosine biosynthesis